MVNLSSSAEMVQDGSFFENRISCEWLSTTSAAVFLDISPNAIRIMVHRGKLKAYKLGGRLRFRVRELRLALEERS